MGDEERRIKNVAEYSQELLAIAKLWSSPVLAFRGQEDKRWLLESSAERRLNKGRGRIPDNLFIEYHMYNLVQKGKLRNYDKLEGKQLADLELLAELQHHGAATCLLDFTRHALVALWFACENSHGESDGKVFVVNTADDHGGFQEVTPSDITGKSIKEVLEFKTRDEDPASKHTEQDSLKPPSDEAKFWYWTPAHLNERITAQGSLFLFARPSSGKPSSEDIVVAAGCKEQIRKELETLYNTHEEALFPDFVGFAYTQRHDAPVDIPDSSEEYIRRGIEAAQRGEKQQAIEHYTKAIELQPEDSDTYFRRGEAYNVAGSHDLAIQDWNKSIELNPDRGNAYWSRAIAHLIKGDFALAIQDYTKLIELNPDEASTYILRAIAHTHKGDFALAIQDYTKLIELNPDDAFAYWSRGSIHYNKGEFDLAIQDFDKALALRPDYTNSYFSRSLVWLCMSKWTDAESDLTSARSKGLDITTAFSNMYWSVEDFEQKHEVKLPPVIASMLSTKPESTV